MPAVAKLGSVRIRLGGDGFFVLANSVVVRLDDDFNVWHTAVTYFSSISIENLVKRVTFGEVFVD